MIIGINGKIGSGKDTVGQIIQYLTTHPESLRVNPVFNQGFEYSLDYSKNKEGFSFHNSNWKIKKFAGKLKQIASILTGATLEQLEDQDFKKQYIGESWRKLTGAMSEQGLGELMTYRELLQKLGTEAMRNGLHENVWVNALMADYVPISDISKSNTYTDNRLQHGYKGTKIWRTYHNIKQRCGNTKHPRYNDYGGRSITMCEEWLNDVSSFINWAIENGYNESLTIDRIDNNKGYSPDNCRCVSYAIQSTNTNLRKDNTSGYKGVTKDSHNWRAQIQIKGKQKFLGYFNTAEEASEAYENAFMEREGLYLKEEENNLIYPLWCITDMRFPNEMDAVKAKGGITIRVNGMYVRQGDGKATRTYSETGDHPSETALDNHKFDYVIDNDGTISDLIDKVKNILTLNNII